MRVNSSGLYIDNPAFPLLDAVKTYDGTTTGDGNATGTSLVDTALANEPLYDGDIVKVLTGDAAGQSRFIWSHVGNTLSVPLTVPFRDSAGAIVQIVAGTRFCILSTGLGFLSSVVNKMSPTVHLYEGWMDEVGGIDPNVWAMINPATGVAWAIAAVNADLIVASTPNANENCRLRSVQRWVVAPTLYGTNRVFRKVSLEFELSIVNLLSIDNTGFLMGFTPGGLSTRATNELIVWSLVGGGNALQALTDLGGVETVTTGFGENLANVNKLKIEVTSNAARFFLNEALVATHITNLPDNPPKYINFYVPTNAIGTATPRIGIVRCWQEDLVL